MILEIFMNVTEALLHLFLINSLIPAQSKKFEKIKSIGFVGVLTTIFCILTYCNLNFDLIFNVILFAFLLLYTVVRNYKFDNMGRAVIALLSVYIVYFSSTIGYLAIYYLFDLTVFEVLREANAFKVLLIVFISRSTYMIMVKLVVYFYAKKAKYTVIKQKHMLIASVICGVYMFALHILLDFFNQSHDNAHIAVQIMFTLGVILFISLVFIYYVMKSSYLESIHSLEEQKNEYDQVKLLSFTKNIKTLTNLKQEILEMLTPVVQVLNNYEYEEARQMLEDYLCVLDENLYNMETDHKLDDKVSATINLKVEECKQKNIDVRLKIKADNDQPTIFNNYELLSIITNLFDITLKECDDIGDFSSLCFTYDTRATCIFMETVYHCKRNIDYINNNIIDFLPETLLKISLSKLGGYTTKTKVNEKTHRKVILPYVGKAYYLKGASSYHSGVDK